MEFWVVTAFPHALHSYLNESLFKRAMEKGIVKVHAVDLRKFSLDSHKKIDNKPFGGGPGMVLQIEPIFRAVAHIKRHLARRKKKSRVRTILFSTRGSQFTAAHAKRLRRFDHLIFICGRYEGVDERVATHIADEEISIGEYVLSGGELPALVVTECVSRFMPGFLGKGESLEEVKGSYPAYTRPATFRPKGARRSWAVPKVLLTGNHKKIHEWRQKWRKQT